MWVSVCSIHLDKEREIIDNNELISFQQIEALLQRECGLNDQPWGCPFIVEF